MYQSWEFITNYILYSFRFKTFCIEFAQSKKCIYPMKLFKILSFTKTKKKYQQTQLVCAFYIVLMLLKITKRFPTVHIKTY